MSQASKPKLRVQNGPNVQPAPEVTKDEFLSWPEIPTNPDITVPEIAPEGPWRLSTLYKIAQTGKSRQWQIGFDGINKLYSMFGEVGSPNLQLTPGTEVVPKQTKDMKGQALQEARYDYRNKYYGGRYRPEGFIINHPPGGPVVEEAIRPEELDRNIEPQLAATWKPGSIKRWFVDTPQGRVPLITVQAKLDGVRMNLHRNSRGDIVNISRSGRDLYNVEHINEQIEVFLQYLPPGTQLDGEIYRHGLSMQKLNGILHRRSDQSERTVLQYYIFDIIPLSNPSYENRYNMLLDAYAAYLNDGNLNTTFFILSSTPVWSDKDIHEMHDYYVSQGYEGIMIRTLAGPNPSAKELKEAQYRSGRNNSLRKYKEFDDAEFKIMELAEGKGKDEGAVVFKVGGTILVKVDDEKDANAGLPVFHIGGTTFMDKVKDSKGNVYKVEKKLVLMNEELASADTFSDENGNIYKFEKHIVFDVRPRGSLEDRREWFQHPERFLGKPYTVRFQGFTDDGIPRFPVGVDVRYY